MKLTILIFLTAVSAVAMNRLEATRYVHNETKSDQFTTILTDLNDDGRKDLLIGVDCGPGIDCMFFVFKDVGGDYRFVTTIYLEKNSFEVLKTSHHGLSDILFYTARSLENGNLVRYEFDGKTYQIKKTVIGRAELKELIRPSTIRQPDSSRGE